MKKSENTVPGFKNALQKNSISLLCNESIGSKREAVDSVPSGMKYQRGVYGNKCMGTKKHCKHDTLKQWLWRTSACKPCMTGIPKEAQDYVLTPG